MIREHTSFGRWLVAAALVAMAGVGGAKTTRAATPFVTEIADAYSGAGSYTSLALDAGGNPNISYYSYGNLSLRYAVKQGDTWTIETVDATGDVGSYSSLALDSRGNPHISYYDATNGDLKYAAKQGGVWSIETVDTAGYVGEFTSIALDAQDNPHISYYDATNGTLKYAFKDAMGVWNIETVDPTPNVGLYTSLALDTQGAPYISYYDDTNGDLKVADKTGLAWNIAVVDNGNVGQWTSLALDSRNNPYISYYDVTNGDLKFAGRGGNIWTTETVDAAGTVGRWTSLAFDGEDNPHISYYDAANGILKYTSKIGSSWTAEVVAYGSNVGQYTSLALDAQGNPSISALDVAHAHLIYADAAVHLLAPEGGERWAAGSQQTVHWNGGGTVDVQLSDDGGLTYNTILSSITNHAVPITVPGLTTDQARVRIVRSSPLSTSASPGVFSIAPGLVTPWWTETVDIGGSVARYTSTALDALGHPHVSYYDATNTDLRYAVSDGDTWTVETVDASVDVGTYSSLVLDGQGNPHISYYDELNGDLKYASKSGGAWTLEVVDSGGSVGAFTSLALDAQGNPHISYADYTNGVLKYASKSGGVWTLETVDFMPSNGTYSSLALDSQGNPHISYYNDSAGGLMYAVKTGSLWTLEPVDGVGVGQFTSLALDARGAPNISYYDVVNADLKYAVKNDGAWTVETVDATGDVGSYTSIAIDARGRLRIGYLDRTSGTQRVKVATRSGGTWTTEIAETGGTEDEPSFALDAQGNPHISYYDATAGNLEVTSAAVEMAAPAPATVWPVGASRTVTWNGTGRVDLSLSTDGGKSWESLQEGLTGGSYPIQVPHAPSRFAKLKIERAVPHSVAVTDLFTIQTDITLLSLSVSPAPTGLQGADIAWQTDPGPADLSGYRLEERTGSGDWAPVASLTRETSFHDPAAVPGEEYRLFGVNGYGEALLLGQARFGIPHPLAAGPLPYRGGDLQITFATAGGLGGGTAPARVALFDLQGRRIKTLAEGDYTAGVQTVTWDGRDDAGQRVGAGIYFLRAAGSGQSHTMKVVVVR